MSNSSVLNSIARGLTKSAYELNRWPARMLHRLSKFAYSQATVKMPPELKSATDVHVSDIHKHLADKHAETIKNYFDNNQNCRPTNNGVRKQLIDRSFLQADIDRVAERYGARIDELTIFRLQQTDRKSDRGGITPTGEGWISEIWHSDNDRPGQFKIIIYLSDVTETSAPFEYKVPVKYVPYARRPVNSSRIPYEGEGEKVTGPRGTTLIFKNNIIHKGNYCRDGYRDVIMIGLEIPGPLTHVGDALKKFSKLGFWAPRSTVDV